MPVQHTTTVVVGLVQVHRHGLHTLFNCPTHRPSQRLIPRQHRNAAHGRARVVDSVADRGDWGVAVDGGRGVGRDDRPSAVEWSVDGEALARGACRRTL